MKRTLLKSDISPDAHAVRSGSLFLLLSFLQGSEPGVYCVQINHLHGSYSRGRLFLLELNSYYFRIDFEQKIFQTKRCQMQ